MEHAATSSRPVPAKLWLWIGCATFGGPAAQIGLLHREFVERRAWLDEPEFQRALGLCMLLPGPEALQLAIYIGWRRGGVRGALTAGLGFLGPAAILLLGLSFVYARGANVPVVAGALYGLEATVVALIGQALVRLARRSLDTPARATIAGVTLLALIATHLPYPLLLAGAAVAGIAFVPRTGAVAVGRSPLPPGTARAIVRTCTAGLVLWTLPLAALLASGTRGLPLRLYLFMSKAALLTFGGAYAIVRYVSDDFVRVHGWITIQQSVAGLSLAETTPGPLMIVLQFFGFAAGWNDPDAASQAVSGTLCALLASYASFLPSFVLVLLAAPHLDRITSGPRLQAALRGVTAFVVGVIASLGLTVASAVLVTSTYAPRWPAIAITVAAALLLARPRVGLHWILIGGVLAGCAAVWAGG